MDLFAPLLPLCAKCGKNDVEHRDTVIKTFHLTTGWIDLNNDGQESLWCRTCDAETSFLWVPQEVWELAQPPYGVTIP